MRIKLDFVCVAAVGSLGGYLCPMVPVFTGRDKWIDNACFCAFLIWLDEIYEVGMVYVSIWHKKNVLRCFIFQDFFVFFLVHKKIFISLKEKFKRSRMFKMSRLSRDLRGNISFL